MSDPADTSATVPAPFPGGIRGAFNPSGDLNVLQFTAARAAEMRAFEKDVTVIRVRNLTPMMHLPVRLRRRAASHKMKRLPRRLHRFWSNVAKAKVVKRKYKRRPRQMNTELARRSRKSHWLETHLWHAKRFRMVTRWNCRIPLMRNDKVFRSCHRNSLHGALLMDLSYISCVELKGIQSVLISGISKLLSDKVTPRINQEPYIGGRAALQAVLYQPDEYPYGAIGPARLIWGPQVINTKTLPRQLWVWVHPSILDDIIAMLASLFSLEPVMSSAGVSLNVTKQVSQKAQSTSTELPSNAAILKSTPRLYRSQEESKKSIEMDILVDSLSCFRLVGSNSHQMLADVLRDSCTDMGGPDWLAWQQLSQLPNADLVPHNLAIRINCPDPRYSRPGCKTKDRGWQVNGKLQQHFTLSELKVSDFLPGIFDKDTRLISLKNMKTDFQVYQEKTSSAVVSANAPPESHFPLLLLHQPHETGSGWDIVFPAGGTGCIARGLWLALIYRGAETGGLRELERHGPLESGEAAQDSFPDAGWPDTKAGQREVANRGLEQQRKHNARPPTRRPNYAHFGTSTSPFQCDWPSLLLPLRPRSSSLSEPHSSDANTNTVSNKWFVLRDKLLLSQLVSRIFTDQVEVTLRALRKYDSNLLTALVEVKIESLQKGVPNAQSVLCLPCEPLDLTSLPLQPPTPASLVRPLVGFIERGEIRLSNGKGVGLGFIGLARLIDELAKYRDNDNAWWCGGGMLNLLFKNVNTNQFRACSVTLVI